MSFCARFHILCVGLCGFFGLVGAADAHPAHSSLLEIEVVSQTGGKQTLEVSWDIERQDLELELAMQHEKHVAFDAGESFHELLVPWLEKNFLFANSSTSKRKQASNAHSTSTLSGSAREKQEGSHLKKRFVLLGKELGATRMVLFFSISLEEFRKLAPPNTSKEHLPRLRIVVPAFLSLDENYVNLVNLRRCLAGEPEAQNFRFDHAHLEPQTLHLECGAARATTSPSLTKPNVEAGVAKKSVGSPHKSKHSPSIPK